VEENKTSKHTELLQFQQHATFSHHFSGNGKKTGRKWEGKEQKGRNCIEMGEQYQPKCHYFDNTSTFGAPVKVKVKR